jgi:hypothetical protein
VLKKVLLALAALVLIGASAYYAAMIRPWTAPPPVPRETVEARWAKVREWAALERRESGDPRLLLEGVAELRKADPERNEVDRFLRARETARRAGASQPAATLSVNAESALVALVRWHEAGGGLGPRVDPSPALRSKDLISLGRVALATAGPDPSAPRRTAAMHLGRALRHEGSLLHAVQGFRLAAEAGPPCTGPFAPTRGDVFAAIAADAVRGYETTAEAMLRRPLQPEHAPEAKRPRWGAPVVVDRELLMLRWYLAEVLHTAQPERDALARLAQVLDEHGRRELPKSTLVRVASPVGHYAREAQRMADYLSQCQTGKRVEREPRY